MIIIKPAIILNGKEFFNKIFPKKVADAPNIIKTTEKPRVNKIMGSKNNNRFFFNKGGEQNFNKDLDQNIIDEINKKYKDLLLELNYLKN